MNTLSPLNSNCWSMLEFSVLILAASIGGVFHKHMLFIKNCQISNLRFDFEQAGVAIGRLCEKCDGRCVICDSYVRPCTLVRICDECNYGSYQGRLVP